MGLRAVSFRRPTSTSVQGTSRDNEAQDHKNPPLREPGSQAKQPCHIDEGQNYSEDEEDGAENPRICLSHSLARVEDDIRDCNY